MTHFCKISHAFITRDRVSTTTRLVSVHGLNAVSVVTNLQQTLRGVLRLGQMKIQICYLHSDLWTEVIVAKFVLYVITYS